MRRGEGGTTPPAAERRLTWLAALAAAAFIVFSIGSPLAGTSAFHSTQLLNIWAPWKAASPTGAPTGNVCVSDTVDTVVPQRAEIASALRHGKLETFDSYDSGGAALGVSDSAGFYEPTTFLPGLLMPTWLALGYQKALELVVCIVGMALFFRRLGASLTAGVVAGIAYGASGFLVVWTNWPQASVAAFVPMLFWTIERLVQRRTASSAALLALPVASMLLGGFPAVTGWSAYAAIGYLAVRVWAQSRRAAVRNVALAGSGCVVALGISAFQLLPFALTFHQQNFSYRAQESTGFLPARNLATALVGTAYGTCHAPFAFDTTNPVEGNVFVGSVALMLVLVALTGRLRPTIARGVRPYFVLTGLIAAHQAFANDVVSRAVAQLPVFAGNAPGRLRFLVGFCAAVLAGFGLDRVIARRWRPRWWRRPQTAVVAAVWLGAAVAVAIAAVSIRRFDLHHPLVRSPTRNVAEPLAFAAVAAALVLLAASTRRARIVATVALTALLTAQGASFAHAFWAREPRSAFYPVTATHAYLAAHLGNQRAVGIGSTLRPGTGFYYEQASAVGRAFVLPGWGRLLTQIDPNAFASATNLQLHGGAEVLTSPILDQLSVRYGATDLGTPVPGPVHTLGSGSSTTLLRDGVPVDVPVDSTGIRSIGVTLRGFLSGAGDPDAQLDVELRNAAGETVSRGTVRIYAGLATGTQLAAALPYTAAAGPLTARLILRDTGQSVAVAARGTTPQLTIHTSTDDGLRIVQVTDSVLYERLDARARVRWAGTVRVVPDAQIPATLTSPLPPGTALSPVPLPSSGAGATVRDVQVRNARTSAAIDAQGRGYLVVANAAVPDWHATVDGKSVPVVTLDGALQGVAVPAGEHVVQLRYEQPGQRAGIAITLAFVVGMLAFALGSWWRRHRLLRAANSGAQDGRP